jgi:uncharacterized alkaline shock family protein YloU
MKITIENYGKKMSVETDHEDLGIDEYIDIFYGLLVSVTFNESTIINGFKEFIELKEL